MPKHTLTNLPSFCTEYHSAETMIASKYCKVFCITHHYRLPTCCHFVIYEKKHFKVTKSYHLCDE